METLTEEEREHLTDCPNPVSGKALRIIDQLSAALADKALVLEKCAAYKDDLAAANAPPGRIWEAMGELTSYLIDGKHMLDVDDVRRVFEAHLAGQPATAPTRTQPPGDWSDLPLANDLKASIARTAAEQAVLDAMGEFSEEWLRTNWCSWRKVADAELARRGLK